MNETLFKKLVNAKSINAIAKLVGENCAIANQFNPPAFYVAHIVDNYKKQIKIGKDDKSNALRYAKFRACNAMGGSYRQQKFVLLGATP